MLRHIIPFTIFIALALTFSCNKNEFLSSSEYSLTYSIDTIRFDTIFSEKGSITRSFKIKNPHKGRILIDEISLLDQENLEYFINVNGVSSKIVNDVELGSGDSLFVFVQAKLKPNSSDTAILHEDKLIIEYNSKSDNIIVQAWGQNVNNYKGSVIGTETFTKTIPYVIYDSLVVEEGEVLTIEAGAKLYFHYNANLIVRGSLVINGTLEEPVVFTSDRLENTYQLLPGQWGSIIFEKTSTANYITYGTIKNGTNALLIRGDAEHKVPVNISNTKIFNMSSNIIFGKNAELYITNSILANCNGYVLALQGGKCMCKHSTISNDGTVGGRNFESSVYITDYDFTDNSQVPFDTAYFYNSIVIGQISNEISISFKHSAVPLVCKFDYCLLKDTYVASDASYYGSNVYYNSAKNLFNSSSTYDFRLDTLSQAIDIGKLEYVQSNTVDYLNNSRTEDSKPDVGAFEYFVIDEE